MSGRSVLAVIPFVAAACVTVRPVAAPATFIPKSSPELVWVTVHSGEVIPLSRPSVKDDSVTGQWLGTTERVSVSLPQVRVIHAAQPDRRRTTALIVGLGLVAGFVAWRAIESGNRTGGCYFDTNNYYWCP